MVNDARESRHQDQPPKDNVATKKANAAAIKREGLALHMTDTTAMDADTRAWYNEQRALIFKKRAAAATPTTEPTSPPATGYTSAAMTERPSTANDPIHI
jgi:uncharacterized protein YccT (UPF0319 family)